MFKLFLCFCWEGWNGKLITINRVHMYHTPVHEIVGMMCLELYPANPNMHIRTQKNPHCLQFCHQINFYDLFPRAHLLHLNAYKFTNTISINEKNARSGRRRALRNTDWLQHVSHMMMMMTTTKKKVFNFNFFQVIFWLRQ